MLAYTLDSEWRFPETFLPKALAKKSTFLHSGGYPHDQALSQDPKARVPKPNQHWALLGGAPSRHRASADLTRCRKGAPRLRNLLLLVVLQDGQ